MITSNLLARVARTTLVLPFLIAALLGLGLHHNAATIHSTISASSQQVADVNPPPPSH